MNSNESSDGARSLSAILKFIPKYNGKAKAQKFGAVKARDGNFFEVLACELQMQERGSRPASEPCRSLSRDGLRACDRLTFGYIEACWSSGTRCAYQVNNQACKVITISKGRRLAASMLPYTIRIVSFDAYRAYPNCSFFHATLDKSWIPKHTSSGRALGKPENCQFSTTFAINSRRTCPRPLQSSQASWSVL